MQWLGTPDHQCIDPLYLWVISWNPSSACRSRDLNSHTDAVRSGILSVPDTGVTLLGAEEAAAPGEGRAAWVTVARHRLWTCCWLRQGHWQAPLLLPITPALNAFRPLLLTGTCKIQGEIIHISFLASVHAHVCVCVCASLCAAILMFTCIYGDILKQAKRAALQPYVVLSTAKIFQHQFFYLI